MGPFIRRTDEQLQKIPALADTGVAFASAWLAASAVAPFLMAVDKAVVSYTATRQPLTVGILRGMADFRWAASWIRNPALYMVTAVYGLTYTAANVSDVIAERSSSETLPAHYAAGGKFVATTAVNMASSIAKDAAFARMFSSATASLAAGTAATTTAATVALRVPIRSYLLFATRDCFTIGGAFFVPNLIADTLRKSSLTTMSDAQANMTAQLLTPPLMQLVCTPIHVLALQFVQVPTASSAMQRLTSLASAVPAVFCARALRMIPAYGVGGILNSTLQTWGRQVMTDWYCPEIPAPADTPHDFVPTPATYLYGAGLHPVMLAREWVLLVNGQDVVQFIADHDENGDGKLDLEEVRHLLAKHGLYEGAEELIAVGDLNGDGKIDAEELQALLLHRSNTLVSYQRRPTQVEADDSLVKQ